MKHLILFSLLFTLPACKSELNTGLRGELNEVYNKQQLECGSNCESVDSSKRELTDTLVSTGSVDANSIIVSERCDVVNVEELIEEYKAMEGFCSDPGRHDLNFVQGKIHQAGSNHILVNYNGNHEVINATNVVIGKYIGNLMIKESSHIRTSGSFSGGLFANAGTAGSITNLSGTMCLNLQNGIKNTGNIVGTASIVSKNGASINSISNVKGLLVLENIKVKNLSNFEGAILLKNSSIKSYHNVKAHVYEGDLNNLSFVTVDYSLNAIEVKTCRPVIDFPEPPAPDDNGGGSGDDGSSNNDGSGNNDDQSDNGDDGNTEDNGDDGSGSQNDGSDGDSNNNDGTGDDGSNGDPEGSGNDDNDNDGNDSGSGDDGSTPDNGDQPEGEDWNPLPPELVY